MVTNQFFALFDSATPGPSTATVTHTLKFYIHPDLVPDMNFAKAVLPKYVSDMNYILAKNTTRQFTFDPETGITLTSTQPHTGSAGVLPTTGFEVWSHVNKTAIGETTSNSGFFSFDVSGAAVLAGMKWLQLYDRDVLVTNTPQLQDYWTQVYIMLHELGHVFCVAIGEYYNLATVNDTTGVPPLLNVNLANYPSDAFWSDKPDWIADPMLRIVYGQSGFGSPPRSYQLVMSLTKFSNLSAAILSGNYRMPSVQPPTVDLQNITIKVVDNTTQAPIPNANIKIWSVTNTDVTALMFDSTANGTGTLIFAWGGGVNPHNSVDFLRLIKVYATGYTAKAKYVSIWDTDITKIVDGNSIHIVTIALET